jgi:hypothetical protein
MPLSRVATIERLRVDSVDILHTTGQRWVKRLNHKVVVVGHQAVGVAKPVEPLDSSTHDLQEHIAVVIV